MNPTRLRSVAGVVAASSLTAGLVPLLTGGVARAEVGVWDPEVTVLSEPILIAADGDAIPFDTAGLGGDMFAALPQDELSEHEQGMVDDVIEALNWERTNRGMWELIESDNITAIERRWVEQMASDDEYPYCKPHPGSPIVGACDIDPETQLGTLSGTPLNLQGGGATAGAVATQTAGGFVGGLITSGGNHRADVLGYDGRFAGVGVKCMPDGRTYWTWSAADYDPAYKFASPAWYQGPDVPAFTPSDFGRRCPQPSADWQLTHTDTGVGVELTSQTPLRQGRLEIDGPTLGTELSDYMLHVKVLTSDQETVFDQSRPMFDASFQYAEFVIPTLPAGDYEVVVRQFNSYETTQTSSKPLTILGQGPSGAPDSHRFEPIDPVRVADTRSGFGGRLAAGTVRSFTLPDLPDGTSAVTVNLVAVKPATDGYLTSFPCPAGTTSPNDRPTTASVNYQSEFGAVGSQVTVAVTDSTLCVYSSAASDVVIDLQGIWTDEADTAPSASEPTRLYDSRTDAFGGRRAAGSVLRLTAGTDGARAVSLNVATAQTEQAGFITVYGCESTDTPLPLVAAVNSSVDAVRPNLVTVAVPADGGVCVYTSSTTAIVIDRVAQWYDASDIALTAETPPKRILDTREGPGIKVPAQTDRSIAPPFDGSLVLSVVAVNATENGWLAVFPCEAGYAGTANTNFAAGRNVTAAVVVDASQGGVCVRSSSPVHVVADQYGTID